MTSPIVALALVPREELELLGPQFERAYLVDEAPSFGELLHAIDVAEREVWRERARLATDNTPLFEWRLENAERAAAPLAEACVFTDRDDE